MKKFDSVISSLQQLLRKKSHIIFDFDKTIAQIEIDWSNWYAGVAAIYREFDSENQAGSGPNPHEHYNLMVDRHGETLANAVIAFNESYEQEHVTGFTPHQELVDLILSLDTHKQYVYSSNSKSTVTKGIQTLGIAHKFMQVVTRNDVIHLKPHPEGFNRIKGLDSQKSQALMVGDSSSDKKAAQAYGIDYLESNYFEKFSFG